MSQSSNHLRLVSFTLLKWPPQSPDLNPIEHLWDVVEREICIMDVQSSNLQQQHDAIMSIWTNISEECLQHLVESMPRRIKAVLKAKGGPTGTSKVYLKKLPVSVCVCMYVCMHLYIHTHTHRFPHDFVRLVAAGDVTLICIFITSFRKVCVQTSFGTSDLFYSMNCHILHYNWMPNKAVHIIFSVVIHKSINKLIINLWMSWRIPSVSLLVKWWLLLKY